MIKKVCLTIVFVLGIFGGIYGLYRWVDYGSTPNTSLSTSDSEVSSLMVNQQLPEFTVTTLEGQLISSRDFKGKPTLIMEWVSWCPHCQQQMPIIEQLYKQYKEQVNFVLIDATGFNGETVEDATAYMTAQGYTVPWYVDNGWSTGSLLQVSQTPTIFLVDANQTIQIVFETVQSQEILQDAIESLVNQ